MGNKDQKKQKNKQETKERALKRGTNDSSSSSSSAKKRKNGSKQEILQQSESEDEGLLFSPTSQRKKAPHSRTAKNCKKVFGESTSRQQMHCIGCSQGRKCLCAIFLGDSDIWTKWEADKMYERVCKTGLEGESSKHVAGALVVQQWMDLNFPDKEAKQGQSKSAEILKTVIESTKQIATLDNTAVQQVPSSTEQQHTVQHSNVGLEPVTPPHASPVKSAERQSIADTNAEQAVNQLLLYEQQSGKHILDIVAAFLDENGDVPNTILSRILNGTLNGTASNLIITHIQIRKNHKYSQEMNNSYQVSDDSVKFYVLEMNINTDVQSPTQLFDNSYIQQSDAYKSIGTTTDMHKLICYTAKKAEQSAEVPAHQPVEQSAKQPVQQSAQQSLKQPAGDIFRDTPSNIT